MKAARVVVLAVAVVAGGAAALLASRPDAPAPATVVVQPKVDTTDVLVAKADIGMGHTVQQQDLLWQAWPASAANANFIRRTDKPQATEQLAGSIARAPFVAGEPIRESKLIKANGSGFMAAILPAGMRAISVEISPETGAGGFILPNDHVDVILTRRDREAEKRAGVDVHTSTTILSNIRVLAIDQAIEEKNGQKVVVGKTATLELAPQQAERLALSRQLGSLSLALRSIVDSKDAVGQAEDDASRKTRNELNMVRYGITIPTTPR
jgi:pilus assembly protein CpaB